MTQPPDLWIHHDRLELKNIDNHNPHSGSSRPSSPLHATTVLSHAGSHFFLSSLTLNSFAYLALFFCFKFSCSYFTACFLSDTADLEDKNTTYTSTSTLDRRTPYHSTYLSKLSIVVTTIMVTTIIVVHLLCNCLLYPFYLNCIDSPALFFHEYRTHAKPSNSSSLLTPNFLHGVYLFFLMLLK